MSTTCCSRVARRFFGVPVAVLEFAQQEGDVLFRNKVAEFATLDERECEGVVQGGFLASDVGGGLEVRLDVSHHLLGEVVRDFNGAVLQDTFHGRPFSQSVLEGLCHEVPHSA